MPVMFPKVESSTKYFAYSRHFKSRLGLFFLFMNSSVCVNLT